MAIAGDVGSGDPDGANIEVRGAITANQVTIRGEGDEDRFILDLGVKSQPPSDGKFLVSAGGGDDRTDVPTTAAGTTAQLMGEAGNDTFQIGFEGDAED